MTRLPTSSAAMRLVKLSDALSTTGIHGVSGGFRASAFPEGRPDLCCQVVRRISAACSDVSLTRRPAMAVITSARPHMKRLMPRRRPEKTECPGLTPRPARYGDSSENQIGDATDRSEQPRPEDLRGHRRPRSGRCCSRTSGTSDSAFLAPSARAAPSSQPSPSFRLCGRVGTSRREASPR
jgi:hypothetical protein